MLIQLGLHVIGYDIWFYLTHLALHTRWLWWIHRIHHEKVTPSWRDTYYGHWLETGLQSVGFGLPWIFGLQSVWVSLFTFLLINMRGVMHHDPRFSAFVGDYHLIHHRNPRVNFGQPWLDHLGGTNQSVR